MFQQIEENFVEMFAFSRSMPPDLHTDEDKKNFPKSYENLSEKKQFQYLVQPPNHVRKFWSVLGATLLHENLWLSDIKPHILSNYYISSVLLENILYKPQSFKEMLTSLLDMEICDSILCVYMKNDTKTSQLKYAVHHMKRNISNERLFYLSKQSVFFSQTLVITLSSKKLASPFTQTLKGCIDSKNDFNVGMLSESFPNKSNGPNKREKIDLSDFDMIFRPTKFRKSMPSSPYKEKEVKIAFV